MRKGRGPRNCYKIIQTKGSGLAHTYREGMQRYHALTESRVIHFYKLGPLTFSAFPKDYMIRATLAR